MREGGANDNSFGRTRLTRILAKDGINHNSWGSTVKFMWKDECNNIFGVMTEVLTLHEEGWEEEHFWMKHGCNKIYLGRTELILVES